MKSKLQTYLQSAAILLALTLLFSLIFAALYYFTWISAETFHILNWIGGAIAYGLSLIHILTLAILAAAVVLPVPCKPTIMTVVMPVFL